MYVRVCVHAHVCACVTRPHFGVNIYIYERQEAASNAPENFSGEGALMARRRSHAGPSAAAAAAMLLSLLSLPAVVFARVLSHRSTSASRSAVTRASCCSRAVEKDRQCVCEHSIHASCCSRAVENDRQCVCEHGICARAAARELRT